MENMPAPQAPSVYSGENVVLVLDQIKSKGVLSQELWTIVFTNQAVYFCFFGKSSTYNFSVGQFGLKDILEKASCFYRYSGAQLEKIKTKTGILGNNIALSGLVGKDVVIVTKKPLVAKFLEQLNVLKSASVASGEPVKLVNLESISGKITIKPLTKTAQTIRFVVFLVIIGLVVGANSIRRANDREKEEQAIRQVFSDVLSGKNTVAPEYQKYSVFLKKVLEQYKTETLKLLSEQERVVSLGVLRVSTFKTQESISEILASLKVYEEQLAVYDAGIDKLNQQIPEMFSKESPFSAKEQESFNKSFLDSVNSPGQREVSKNLTLASLEWVKKVEAFYSFLSENFSAYKVSPDADGKENITFQNQEKLDQYKALLSDIVKAEEKITEAENKVYEYTQKQLDRSGSGLKADEVKKYYEK